MTEVKDPRRVAAGKRLGAISKQRKEEKRLEREAQAYQVADNEYTLYLVGGLVVVGAVSCLYLNKDKVMEMFTSDRREETQKKKLPTIPEEPASPPKRKSKRIFDNY